VKGLFGLGQGKSARKDEKCKSLIASLQNLRKLSSPHKTQHDHDQGTLDQDLVSGHGQSQAESELSYFDHGAAHPIKQSGTGSPSPNSGTTTGSSGTPSSFGGISSGESGPIKSESPPTNLQRHPDASRGDQAWSLSVPGYPSSPSASRPTGPAGESSEKRYNPAAYPSAIKLLVSNNVAGSIIGRAGQTISELQTQSSARIKLSQTGDFYPGTQDRVCLVQGQLENVQSAVRLLLERIYMLQEQQHSQHVTWHPNQSEAVPDSPGFDFVVRLLVPNSCCGMIIGKGGTSIKQMEEASGVSSVRLSPKESEEPKSPSAAAVAGTSERVVTLTGPSMESCLKCLCIVLDGMMAHHDISRYSNMTTSYSRVAVPGAFSPVSPSGQPVQHSPGEGATWEVPGQYGQFVAKRSTSSPDLAGQMMWDQRGPPPRMPGEVPGTSMSRRDPMQHYNPGYDTAQTFPQDMPPMMQSQLRGPPGTTSPSSMYLLPSPTFDQVDQASTSNSASAPDLALQLQESLRISNTPPPSPVDYSHFAHQLPQPTPPDFTAQVLVPDTLVGSILGRGGRTLNELQMHSNTRIRISQRGEFVPGTRNRIVTIQGSTAQSVSYAQYLMSQRMVLPPTANYSQAAPHPSQIPQRHGQPHAMPQPSPTHLYDGGQQPIYQGMQDPPPTHVAHNLPQGNTNNDPS
jgi:RNA-binding protein Nova